MKFINSNLQREKFPSSEDTNYISEQEYNYSLCAKECGIVMEETR